MLGGGRLSVQRLFEENGMAHPIQVDAVDVVIARHLRHEGNGAVADTLQRKINARPPAALPAGRGRSPVPRNAQHGFRMFGFPLRPQGRRERVVDIVHAQRPKRLVPVCMGEFDGKLERVGTPLHQDAHVVVFEGPFLFCEHLANVRGVREIIERLGCAIEKRVRLRAAHVNKADANEPLRRGGLRRPDVVAVVVEDDPPLAVGELFAFRVRNRSE